jgi:signal transduction histidine kinase
MLTQALQRQTAPMTTAQMQETVQVERLTQGTKMLLQAQGIQLWVPLVFDEILEGLLLLGPKEADDVYTDEDLAILETLGHQAATTARNVRLVAALRQHVREIMQSRQELRQAHRRLLAGREDERRRLARDLHDGPLQALLGFSYQLRAQARQISGEELSAELQTLRQELLQIVNEIRHICMDLRPPALDLLGLPAAMQAHAENLGGHHQARIRLDLDGAPMAIPDDVAISIFRIYQEALHNALRHSEAGCVQVRFWQAEGVYLLQVEDNGRGSAFLTIWHDSPGTDTSGFWA